jgi:hypothetical protein
MPDPGGPQSHRHLFSCKIISSSSRTKRAEMFLRASLETARILLNYQPATVSMMAFKTPTKPRSPKTSDPAHYLNLTTV